MPDLTDDELRARLQWAMGERHLEPFVEPLRELQRHRAAQAAGAARSDLTDIRDRITRLTLAAGLPPDVWSEPCKIDSDLRAAIRAQTASAPHVNAELATIGPLMTQAEVEQLRAERDDPGDDAERVREIVVSVASVDVRAVVREAVHAAVGGGIGEMGSARIDATTADAIADRVAAQLTAPPPCPDDAALAAMPPAQRAELEALDRGEPVPGHAVPYGLDPGDLDVLTEMAAHAELLDWPRGRAVIGRILAMHRAPHS